MIEQPVAEAKCPSCQATIFLRMPPFRIMNTPELSLIVLPHEKPQFCQQCGKGFVPLIKGMAGGQLEINWAPVEPQKQPLIAPPSPQQTRAIEATKTKGLVMP